jgi:hypothetical protein
VGPPELARCASYCPMIGFDDEGAGCWSIGTIGGKANAGKKRNPGYPRVGEASFVVELCDVHTTTRSERISCPSIKSSLTRHTTNRSERISVRLSPRKFSTLLQIAQPKHSSVYHKSVTNINYKTRRQLTKRGMLEHRFIYAANAQFCSLFKVLQRLTRSTTK